MTNKRKIIVNLATSADGYIARPDGDIEWLTRRPTPKGFYGLGEFERSIDTKLLGRKTYDIAAFLDEGAIDEFIITVVPTLIGEGIPLMGRQRRDAPLRLRSVEQFPDGVVQLHYNV